MSNTNTNKKMKQIVGAVERTNREGVKKTYWSRIGVAFENSDGSWNQQFDYFPTNVHPTTIQLRDFDPREE